MNRQTGFTLIEMLVVIVVMGILSAIGLAVYTGIKEKATDREAKASLFLIQVAERNYRMEHASFYPSLGTIDNTTNDNRNLINNNLKLSLPANPQWTVTLDCTGTGFATATRLGRTWRIDFPSGSSETPACSGTGCPSTP